MRQKKFYLRADQIKPLVPGRGGCFAPDSITVEGSKVGFMYRQSPDNDTDSGWRFMRGDESQECMDNSDNIGFYDLNTIANYDPEIIAFLDAPVGSAFARDRGTGEFVEVDFQPDE
jgi:hypothetical protein